MGMVYFYGSFYIQSLPQSFARLWTGDILQPKWGSLYIVETYGSIAQEADFMDQM